MTAYEYTGTLTDVGVLVPSSYQPSLSVRPEQEAFSADGVVTSKRVPVTVSEAGEFSMTLIPSSELNASSGSGPVRYVLELVLFSPTADGEKTEVAHDQWRFTALTGGGPIADMGDVSPISFIVGPPWPTRQIPGTYFDTETGDLGYYGITIGG